MHSIFLDQNSLDISGFDLRYAFGYPGAYPAFFGGVTPSAFLGVDLWQGDDWFPRFRGVGHPGFSCDLIDGNSLALTFRGTTIKDLAMELPKSQRKARKPKPKMPKR